MQEIYEHLAQEMNTFCLSDQNILYSKVGWTWKDVESRRGFCRAIGLWNGCAGDLCTSCASRLKRLDRLKHNHSDVINDVVTFEEELKQAMETHARMREDIDFLLGELKGRDTAVAVMH